MAKTMAEFKLRSLGIFHGSHFSKSSLPRQGHLSGQSGYIEFESGFDHKLGLTGIEKMSHIWLIFIFHKSESAPKPLVRPPRAPDQQVGVYATRSPYRPNPIGLTLAKVDKIENGKLYLSSVDLLDQTPILDIKPYVSDSDQAIHPIQGWIDQVQAWTFSVSDRAQQKIDWLIQNGVTEFYDVLVSQLETPPLQLDRKRIKKLDSGQWILSYRTWRILLSINELQFSSEVLDVISGYSEEELLEMDNDPYGDKGIHLEFKKASLL